MELDGKTKNLPLAITVDVGEGDRSSSASEVLEVLLCRARDLVSGLFLLLFVRARVTVSVPGASFQRRSSPLRTSKSPPVPEKACEKLQRKPPDGEVGPILAKG